LSRPLPPRSSSSVGSFVRVNGKIRAREVRVIGHDGKQLGVLSLGDAINMARSLGVDLVEVAPNATPPVCRLVDYGKYRYEQSKKDKEARKHQHANKVKEIQLSATIDPHDFGVKVTHAVDFLCDEMKVKISLRFRGREMAHQEFGFQVVRKFIQEIGPYGHPDAEPKLVGRGLNVMVSPLPRNKRAKNPGHGRSAEDTRDASNLNGESDSDGHGENKLIHVDTGNSTRNSTGAGGGFANNPFSRLDSKLGNGPT